MLTQQKNNKYIIASGKTKEKIIFIYTWHFKGIVTQNHMGARACVKNWQNFQHHVFPCAGSSLHWLLPPTPPPSFSHVYSLFSFIQIHLLSARAYSEKKSLLNTELWFSCPLYKVCQFTPLEVSPSLNKRADQMELFLFPCCSWLIFFCASEAFKRFPTPDPKSAQKW